MKRIFLFMLIIYSLCAWTQPHISLDSNSLRNGDILHRIQAAYSNPGPGGEDCVWQLGIADKQNPEFIQKIVTSGDTIAILGQERIIHYIVRGDTLWYKGEQGRRSYRLFSPLRPYLHYPFQYGDSISGGYYGEGMDENLKLEIFGWGRSAAEGLGILTDGTDTLKNVIRLHLSDNFTEVYNNEYSISMHEDRYLWFCVGCRYPVMESVRRSMLTNDTTILPLDSITYLYLPEMQTELKEDFANDSVKRETLANDVLVRGKNGIIPGLDMRKAVLSADAMSVVLHFSLSAPARVTFQACDVTGIVIGQAYFESLQEGEFIQQLNLSRHPVGDMIMINITDGERVLQIKVYK